MAVTLDDIATRLGVSRRYESSTGRVGILDEWWTWLGLTSPSGAFSTRPGFDPDRGTLDPWVTLP